MRLHRLHHASSSVIHIRWADPLLAPQATAVTLGFGVNVHTRGCSESRATGTSNGKCAAPSFNLKPSEGRGRAGHREGPRPPALVPSPTSRAATRRGAGASSLVQINREEPVDTQGRSSPVTYHVKLRNAPESTGKLAEAGKRHAPAPRGTRPCLTRTATMRPSTLGRTILCGPAAMARRIRRDAALIRVRREMRWRRGAGARTRAKPRPCVAPCTGGRSTAPVPRGGARAQTRRRSLYTFARAKVRVEPSVEREMGPLLASWAVSFTTLTLPPPLFCVCSIWCLCLCAACLCLCDSVRRTLRPPRCVSTGPVVVPCASCRDGKLT